MTSSKRKTKKAASGTARRSGVQTIGIVGTGVMGRGIAQLAASARFDVVLFDSDHEAVEKSIGFIRSMYQRQVAKDRITEEERASASGRLRAVGRMEALADCDVVIEAIYEDLPAKQILVADLEEIVDRDTLIATNTSSFLVAEVAARAAHPERVVGIHFFNPAPLMALVEIIAGAKTEEKWADKAVALATDLGRTPVRVADVSGFLVNQLGRGYVLEAARAMEQRVGNAAEIDAALEGGLGFRLGPCSLMDLTGLDVTVPASEAIYWGNGREPRYAVPGLLLRRARSGLFGQKAERGFYRYAPEKVNLEKRSLGRTKSAPYWLFKRGAPVERTLTRALDDLEDGEAPSARATVVVPVLGESVARLIMDNGFDPERVIGVDGLFYSRKHLPLVATEQVRRSRVAGLAKELKRDVTVMNDMAGTVCQRIAVQLALIASDLVQRGVSDAPQIDAAAMLALGHAEGPFSRAERVGAVVLETVRSRIYAETLEPRFRPSPWMQGRLMMGQSLLPPSEDKSGTS